MARSKAVKVSDSKYDDWRVDDAMHTMMRAGEIVRDKKLMGLVRTRAKDHAAKMQDVAAQASMLAKKGLISDKAMAKHVKGRPANQGGNVADLDKTRAIA